ncbi:MAG: anthranilate synthase component I family protein [Persicimonas sp.]
MNIRGSKASPVDVARALRLADAPGFLFFDSTPAEGAQDASWSILCCAPTRVLTERAGRFVELPGDAEVTDPIEWLSRSRLDTPVPDHPGLENLPFHGGLAGMLGFEFAWHLDEVRAPRKHAPTPTVWVGDYPTALVYSHIDRTWWLTGDPDADAAGWLLDALENPHNEPIEPGSAERFRLSVSADEYISRCQRAIDAIYAGEIFEVNYTERFSADWSGDAFWLYEQLRATSNGAYCAFLDAGQFQLASVSPEQFLEVDRGRAITRPIKGTRPRSAEATEDAHLAEELQTSEKDRAENVMIVDLMRNDLTRVCELGSVEATEICGLHSFVGVHHLVSTVEGDVADGFSAMDVLLACFPAGSITGAPKLRSIELIAQLEEDARGPYTGTLFYASRVLGRLDSSVLIRTAVVTDGAIHYGAGGAVVADSAPRAEYEEACVKAGPLEQVVTDD